MKYMITKLETIDGKFVDVTVTSDQTTFTSFPAVIGNPNYDAFLIQVGLTDVGVHELEPNVWYDFPQKEEQ